MITEQDLQAAIAECQGERNPNANTCIKLAAFYTIREHMFGEKDQFRDTAKMVQPDYSFAKEPPLQPIKNVIRYESDTDFANAIYGREESEIWPIVDELMSVLQATNKRLYDGVMRKIES